MSKQILNILNTFKNNIPDEFKTYADNIIDAYQSGKIRDNRSGELMAKLLIPAKRDNAIKQINILTNKTSRKEKATREIRAYEEINKKQNQKQYNISGIIEYRIINTDKNNNRIASSLKTKHVNFIFPLMFKSDITN